MKKPKGERKMNEKLQYASMLEIPVNTCNVTVRTGKARKKKKKVDDEQIKSKLISKVNAEVEETTFITKQEELVQEVIPEIEEIDKVQEEQKGGSKRTQVQNQRNDVQPLQSQRRESPCRN